MSESRGREETFAVRSGKCLVWKGSDAGDDAREEEILGKSGSSPLRRGESSVGIKEGNRRGRHSLFVVEQEMKGMDCGEKSSGWIGATCKKRELERC